MDRRDANYYEAHVQTINLEEITSDEYNAAILQKLRDNDPSFTELGIKSECDGAIGTVFIDFFIDEGDDLGWLGYFVGNSDTLESLHINALPETIGVNRFEALHEGLNRNRSIQTLYIGADLGGACFRQMGDFFRNNNGLRDISFGSLVDIGIESARSIAFVLSQCKQSNLRILYFEENSELSEGVLAEIVTAISSHPRLEELTLGYNNLGRDGSVALGNALKACNNPQLKELYLQDSSIDDEGLRALVAGMRNCHNLSQLVLSYNQSITVDGIRSLSTLFQSERCQLKHLDLSSMNIDDDGARAISRGLASLDLLDTLNLSDNAIGDDGARALGAGLVNLRSLVKLDFEENSIGVDGARGIADGLVNLHSLEELDLGGNSIGHVGMRAIASRLVNLRSLETLHLGGNSFGHVGATTIGAGVKTLQSLKELDLGYNSIGDVGAKAIAAGLVKLQSVKELSLGGNSIGDAGARAIAAGLVNLRSIKKIDMTDNSIGDIGIQALVIGLINSVDLEELILSGNRMVTASGLSTLSTLLQSERCSLTNISLRDIPFGDDGAVALVDALKGNKSMEQIYFDADSSRVTSVGWSAFSKLLCDTSSVSATYLSNHYLTTIGNWSNEGTPDDVKALLAWNKHPTEHVAIRKILKSHSNFSIEPFFEWKLKVLPLVVSWFGRVRTLADEHRWISDESAEEIQSRQLSTMYNFVRGMPLVAIDGYRSRNNTAVLAPSRKRKIEQLQLADES